MLNLNTGNVENSNLLIVITKPSEVSPPSGAYQALRYVSYKSIESSEPFNSGTLFHIKYGCLVSFGFVSVIETIY